MERLSLEDFKAKSNNSDEVEQLTGGILGSCHDESQEDNPWWWLINKVLKPIID